MLKSCAQSQHLFQYCIIVLDAYKIPFVSYLITKILKKKSGKKWHIKLKLYVIRVRFAPLSISFFENRNEKKDKINKPKIALNPDTLQEI